MIFELSEVEEIIGYHFTDKMLLRQAFTHSSYINENNGESNERLEFFGDSILNFVITEYLYESFCNYTEGQLSMTRANIVSAFPLAEAIISNKLNLYLLMSIGEQKNIDNKNICADLFEAIVGAIYLDGGGLAEAKKFISKNLNYAIKNAKPTVVQEEINFKTEVAEYAQKNSLQLKYDLVNETGEKHKPIFEIACILSSGISANGFGFSKKSAEQNAAMEVWKILEKQKTKKNNLAAKNVKKDEQNTRATSKTNANSANSARANRANRAKKSNTIDTNNINSKDTNGATTAGNTANANSARVNRANRAKKSNTIDTNNINSKDTNEATTAGNTASANSARVARANRAKKSNTVDTNSKQK